MDKSHATYRRLRIEKKDTVEQCIKKLEELYNAHRILERAHTIVCRIQETKTQEETQELFRTLDKLDAERIKYMISAENFAGKSPPNGIYEWSPSLKKIGSTVTYWKVRSYQKEGGDDRSGILQ